VNRDDKGKPATSESALADYYGDLLGSISDDPLKKLEDAERIELRQQAREVPSSYAKPSAHVEQAQRQYSRKRSTPSSFFQQEKQPDVLTPIVIPSTFPKLAPARSAVSSSQTQTPAPKTETTALPESAPTVMAHDTISQQTSVSIAAPHARNTLEKAEPRVSELETKQPRPWLENGRPVWGQKRFECLLFSVGGLKLAVPLISLGAIYRLEKELTPLVGRADWFMGLYRSGDRNVQVVDTAKWVMPDRWSEKVRDGYQFVIRLGDNNWGMACDLVEQAVQLEPTQVKWRTSRSKRPWLSGTVIDHMCALLDADTLGHMLQQQDKTRL
jgi:purine-binding chemotaxis protein CheW